MYYISERFQHITPKIKARSTDAGIFQRIEIATFKKPKWFGFIRKPRWEGKVFMVPHGISITITMKVGNLIIHIVTQPA